MEAEIPNAELATRDFRKHKSIGQRRVLPAPSASERTRRSPTKSYTRSRVIASDAFSGDGNKLKHVARHDAFERQVFKLKLREADIDEKMIAGPRDEFDNWLCNNRKRAAAEERARLMAQDLKRFEKVYASSNVMPCQLKRYQNDRDFGWRVVQFKRKQASLEDQNDQLMSLERKADLRCRLDREREKLIAENATLYHAVMLSEDQTYKQRERRAFGASANILQGSGQRAFGTNVHQGQPRLKYRTSDASDSSLFMSSANTSRVVVGAALQLKGDNVRRTYP
ncbi:hypothetical protein KXD40_008908 [Peronospora effusa]|uniref:Uncharacterized protein n=1 Tax=Peronospora effusa TaxID=542832 RepID=A0A3M6VLH0_9STRA|nr:hypothetical protein DD238_005483 [Peronospora effusa]RQM12408.1 hypothetical protein DD237_001001 [Peronospora effusa]UIZ22036.1 hypothetical protein KXD40_008908 [Peronospora effusa]CAI5707219.1 unnamed protein product [Peronospora effusa]